MAIVKKYKATVIKIENPVKDIYVLTFVSNKVFQFMPGQFLHLAIDDYDGIGQWPESRCFSIQTSPEEKNLKITYAVKGKFTSRMKNELYEGREVWLKMLYGDLFQKLHDKSNCVFIAGGTGITPFLSLFNSKEFYTYENPKIYLGFRSKEYNIFEEQIRNICNDTIDMKKHVKVYYENIDGILNINTIYAENGKDATYFLSGPPMMVKSFKHFLISNNVAEKKIVTDDWE